MKESDIGKTLIDEIAKWTGRIENELKTTKSSGSKGSWFLENINAYVSDSKHFQEEGDPVRSFEAIIWAWAWLEIGIDLGNLVK